MARPAAWLAGALASCCIGSALAAPPLLAPDGSLHPEWHFVGLPQQRVAPTRFHPERIDGHAGLRLEADQSYGNWLHVFPAPTRLKALRWSWRLDVPNPRTDLTQKAGDDVAARVCISFDLPLAKLPFLERQKLLLARSLSGVDLAAETLCYVWGGREAKGALIPNVFTRRVRQIVLRNALDATQVWYEEQRDVAADYLRAFGDEAEQPQPATALIVGADADNTRQRSLAHVADLEAGL